MLKLLTMTLISFIITGCATTNQYVENKNNGYLTVKEFSITNDKEKIISITTLLISNKTSSEFKKEDSIMRKDVISQAVRKQISFFPTINDDNISLDYSFIFTDDINSIEKEVYKIKNSVLLKNRNPLNIFKYLRISNEVNVETETVYIEVTVNFSDEYLSTTRTKI